MEYLPSPRPFLRYSAIKAPAVYPVGSAKWLAAAEKHFGGLQLGTPRTAISPQDPRSADPEAAGTMIGGDRMFHHGYARPYARFLRPFLARREEPLTIIEIGILNGSGLAMWSNLFPQSRIIGLDIDPGLARRNLENLRARGAFPRRPPELHQFDQLVDGEARIVEVLNGDRADICIDDGAHLPAAILASFAAVQPHLAPEFAYFVEDSHRSRRQLRRTYPALNFAGFHRLTVCFSR